MRQRWNLLSRMLGTAVLAAGALACAPAAEGPVEWADASGEGPADAAVPSDAGRTDVRLEDLGVDAGPKRIDPPDVGGVTDSGSGSGPADAGVASDAGATATATGSIAQTCFGDIWDPNFQGPNYDQFSPTMGSHCYGTDHQDITGIERVVFLGDSVTVGTPPTESSEYYRSVLADQLAQHFGLEAPSNLWKRPNLIDGTSLLRESGDFSSCAKWGARADDLLRDNSQIEDCFPPEERSKRTLVIMTIGGNDIASITKAGAEGTPVPEVWAEAEETVILLRQAVEWFHADPSRFPNGVFVVFANPFEFTDGTGDVSSCPAASAAGFDAPWSDPLALENIVLWLNEQYMDIAVTSQTDMILLLEHFCGHGYRHDDPSTRCYRGPQAERWFDLSCIHPNPTGHSVIADMFMAVVRE